MVLIFMLSLLGLFQTYQWNYSSINSQLLRTTSLLSQQLALTIKFKTKEHSLHIHTMYRNHSWLHGSTEVYDTWQHFALWPIVQEEGEECTPSSASNLWRTFHSLNHSRSFMLATADHVCMYLLLFISLKKIMNLSYSWVYSISCRLYI